MVVGPLGVNCYIVSDNGKAFIVDPGGHAESIVEFLEKNSLEPVAIVNTHGHFDHIGAVVELVKKYDIPFKLHKNDEFLVSHGSETSAMFGFEGMKDPSVTEYLEDGDKLTLEGLEVEVMHTPGHSPGGVCLYIEKLKSVITGDTLFLESIGRSDFPYGDHGQLIGSINSKLMRLDADTKVYPGHGPASSIGHEKSYNPFL